MLSQMVVRQERKERTRQDILAAAREVIATRGFAGTTARDVAATAGVAVGTVFVHFPTMGRLAETLLDDTVGAALTTALADLPAGGLVDQLLHVSATLYDAYRADEELSRQVISGSLFEVAPDGPSRRRIADFATWVGARVDAAVAAGEIAPISAEEAFGAYFSLYFGVLVAGLRGELDAPAQRAVLRAALHRFLRPVGKE
jgi:AcrR family transcriptional regulator